MVKDARRREKKLQRRKAKEKAKKNALAQRGARGLAGQLERAAAAPILHCCTTDLLWDQGMSQVMLSRELKSGHVAYVIFLLDIYCLGVKDVIMGITSRSEYDFKLYGKAFHDRDLVELDPPEARKLIEGAVDYAASFGISPHADYRKAKLIFGDIDAGACSEEFAYGKDGKPYFMAGPNDSHGRCVNIISKLEEHCGPDGFDYMMPVDPTGSGILRIDAPMLEEYDD